MFEPLVAVGVLALVSLVPMLVFFLIRPRMRRAGVNLLVQGTGTGPIRVAMAGLVIAQVLVFFLACIGAYSVLSPAKLDLGLVRKVDVDLLSDPTGFASANGRPLGWTPVRARLAIGKHNFRLDSVPGRQAFDTSINLPRQTVVVAQRLELRIGDDNLAISRPPVDSPVDKSAATEALRKSDAWVEVRPLAQRFYDAGIAGRADELLGFYQFPVESHFGKSAASLRVVREDQNTYYRRWSRRSGKLLTLAPARWDAQRSRLTVQMKYSYRFLHNNGRAYSGISDTYLTWAKLTNTWRVVATSETVYADK